MLKNISTLNAAEDRLIELLQECFLNKVTVKSLPQLNVDDLLKLFGGTVPAIYVTPAPLTLHQSVLTVRWEVLLIAPLGVSQQQGRRGSANSLGAYQMAWRLAALGAAGLDCGPINLYMRQLDWLTGDAATRLAEYGAMCASCLLEGLTSPPAYLDEDDLAAQEDLLTVRADLDLAPFASGAERLQLASDEPAAGLPDTRDVVSLPGSGE